MANKNFKQYAVAGNNITLTYDDIQDTVTFASQSDVTSVNGKDGDVVLVKADVGLGNVDNTSDANKPISTATQTALDTKASITALNSHINDVNNPHNVTKTQIGLGNVDNTSDLNKPISTATQTALNAKQDSIGYTPANAARTITINGVTYDLTANRSWSVGDLVSTGSYSNPSWLTALAWGKITGTPTTIAGYGITDGVSTGGSYANPTWLTSLAWGKITSTPTTLSGYGITDGVSTSGSYSNPSWITDLAFSKITGYSVPTLAQVTTAGATTTNAITVGGLTVATNLIYTDTVNGRVGIKTLTPQVELDVTGIIRGTTAIITSIAQVARIRPNAASVLIFTNAAGTTEIAKLYDTGNLLLQNGGTFTDAGFRLDVNGTARIQNQLTTTGTITAASAIARGVYFNQTLTAAANNDVLVGLDIAPTFTVGAFTGVSNYILRLGTRFQFQSDGAMNYGANADRGRLTWDPSGAYFSGLSGYGVGIGSNGRLNNLFIFTNGNVLIQSGGTLADAGYRLDVNGTARIQNVLTLGSLSADPTGANGMIYYNTTLGMFRVYQSGAWKTITAV